MTTHDKEYVSDLFDALTPEYVWGLSVRDDWIIISFDHPNTEYPVSGSPEEMFELRLSLSTPTWELYSLTNDREVYRVM